PEQPGEPEQLSSYEVTPKVDKSSLLPEAGSTVNDLLLVTALASIFGGIVLVNPNKKREVTK
ncbi:hypothetical protein FPV21_07640, partial [Carnobacterium sp. PL12RED10]|uniref:hypothetical protein n=1 Tax=Carnobacterium sp. PL12RED10 TaxID=2592351 RepID=UPI0013F7CF74